MFDWDWELNDPAFLFVAPLAPIVFWLACRNSSLASFSSLQVVDGAGRSIRTRLSFLPACLLALAVVMVAIALARPRTPNRETRIQREGISIMMVVDRSSSMQARDLVPGDRSADRLSVVKQVFKRFVLGDESSPESGRPDDMIGLVAFARFADSHCPLTLDHGNLAAMVSDIQAVGQLAEGRVLPSRAEMMRAREEDGTSIGDGLALAVERLRRNKAKSKVIILLTDGVNNMGLIDPLKAGELAAENDITVYCIGAGTTGLAPFPIYNNFFNRIELRPTPVEIDEETLEQIAEQSGGKYFRATDANALANIYDQIDQLERTEVSEVRYLQYTEHFVIFVATAFAMLTAAAVLRATVFRRLP